MSTELKYLNLMAQNADETNSKRHAAHRNALNKKLMPGEISMLRQGSNNQGHILDVWDYHPAVNRRKYGID